MTARPGRGRRGPRPWWIPHFLGAVPDLDPALLRLLGLLAIALGFENYDLSMLTSALKFIAEDLDIEPAELGGYTGMVRLGSLPALLVIPFADRLGRRRVFLAALAGASFATVATGFSQSALQFVACQVVARTCVIAGGAVAFVIATEEFPAAHRGWAIGMLAALAAVGTGVGALMFAGVNHLPLGWRFLYFAGVVPLALLPVFRRGIPETARFRLDRARRESMGDTSTGFASGLRPLMGLARTHPWRAVTVGAAGAFLAFGQMPVFQFLGYFTLAVRGWAPWELSFMVVGGGAIGIVGNVVAGRLGDTVGRRVVGAASMSALPVAAALFYLGPGWSVPIGWVMFVFCSSAGQVVLRAFATELFPTSHRGTSMGWLALVETLGAAVGLGVVGLWTSASGELAHVISALSLSLWLAACCVLFLPETRQRELEAISEGGD